MRVGKRIAAVVLSAALAVAGMAGTTISADAEESVQNLTPSQEYVEKMGHGWNLGNSFDGFDGDLNVEDSGEEAWGNPPVTRELSQAVKEKGFDSIRIPMTVHRRYTVNEEAGEGEYKYVISQEWLARYSEVVDWAVEEGLYVMINIHHDSWIWLSAWNGDPAAEEYRMFTDFWKQIAEYFKDEPLQVCFETINEPAFSDSDGITAQEKLDMINKAAYDVIRSTPENEERMIVMPTLNTNHTYGAPLTSLIQSLDDENIIATVHYYSEWVYSANLGKTDFDGEPLWDDYTPKDAADALMETLKTDFTDNGIGVVIGEYGLLGYDTSETCLQEGEELKYYEYMNALAREYGVCLMFWDNGSGIDRNDADYSWKKPLAGEMLETSMTERSSYASGLDSLYYKEEAQEDAEIPLTLNGNEFKGIEGLVKGTDYEYDAGNAVVILKKEFINRCFDSAEEYGVFAELVMQFSGGADWHEYLVKYGTAEIGAADGTRSEGIRIPVNFNGSRVKRVMTYEIPGKVGPNSDWWNYLQYDSAFLVDMESGFITFTSTLFSDASVQDGLMKAVVEFYDGQTADIWMKIEGDTVTSDPEYAVDTDGISVSGIICLYAGETEIPAQYLEIPEGAGVYGTYSDDSSIVSMVGWPASMVFDTSAHENFTNGGIMVRYMDVEAYIDVVFGIKDAPVVNSVQAEVGKTAQITVSNLADDAVVRYETDSPGIAAIDENGTVTGLKEGTAAVKVTVTQYNRTDEFEEVIEVVKAVEDPGAGGSDGEKDPGNGGSENPDGTAGNEPTENMQGTQQATSPRTGDTLPVVWLILAAVSMAAAVSVKRKADTDK